MTVDPIRDPLPRPVRQAFVSAAPPADAFNPLLRSLLGWDLVIRVERPNRSARWELTEGAQQRLEELTATRRSVTPATLAYLDHWCAGCRQQKLTHLVEGRYLCVSCEQLDGATPAPVVPARRPRIRLHHREA